MKKIVAIISFFVLTVHAQHSWEDSPYFDTSFLSKYDLVKTRLIEQDDFKSVTFQSADGIALDGIFLERKNSVGTIIFCAGFFPGRKEGQAPIFKMLPPNYNILFFDARGHAKSDGKFWRTLNKYGKNEYKDVLGAIEFVHKKVGGKIVVYGICAGAFHASHALIKLSQEKKLDHYGIVGMIFDSGFASPQNVSRALQYHIKEKCLPKKLGWYANKKKIKKTFLYRITSFFVSGLACTLKKILIMPGIKSIEPETNLFDKIQNITCPIFFIHCEDDGYVSFHEIEKLANQAQCKTCWWISESSHALHALKHKYEYRKRLIYFLEKHLQ